MARKPARRKRQTQTGRVCKERAAIRGSAVPWGQVQVSGHRAPTATAPKRIHLDSSPAGDGNWGPPSPCVRRAHAQARPPKVG